MKKHNHTQNIRRSLKLSVLALVTGSALLFSGCTAESEQAAEGDTQWRVQRSTEGRTDQFDLVANGSVFRTSGPRNLPLRFRP